MKVKLVSLLLLLCLTACQKKEKGSVEALHNDRLEFRAKDYSIAYDSQFRLDVSGKNGCEFYLFVPRSKAGEFEENINLIIQNLGVLRYDLNRFVTLSEQQIKASGRLIESKRGNVDGQAFHILIFEATINGLPLKFLQYDFVKDDKAYVLTFTSKKEQFNQSLPRAEKVMNSFRME